MKHWLLKSEPGTFSIDDLAAAPRKTTCWDGVRNFQARNFMRDEMRKGDPAFFYHSSCPEPGIVGVVEVVREAYPDHTALDPDDAHFDPDSDPAAPRWVMVDVRLKRRFERTITLEELKAHANGRLKDMIVLRRGNRLSITPVTEAEWRFVLQLSDR
ncbi:MAG TPA: EVE domain-containing protein [Steroidobacteraceae bacterium]|nr:EVE domain-containing protein [Steroidobacteraceae bacterium]